jgi:hypothetical protein
MHINVISGSIHGIATRFALEGPEIENQWGRGIPHLSKPAVGPT